MDILQNNKPKSKVSGGLTKKKLSENLLLLFIFTMPFVSAFSFSGTLSIPLFLSLFLLILMGRDLAIYPKVPTGFAGYDLLLLFLFLIIVVFAYLTNGVSNSRALNHTVAYISSFLLFYVAIKFTLLKIPDNKTLFSRILKVITYTVIVSAVFADVEFIVTNFLNFDINELIPRPIEKMYNPIVVGLFIRARGFEAESGHFAFLMELFSPLAIYYMYFSTLCKWNTLQKMLVVCFIFFSFIFAASSASFAIIPIAVALSAIIHIKKIASYVRRNSSNFIIGSTVIASLVLIFNYFLSLYALVLLSITDKLDSGSFDDRQERIDFFFEKFAKLDLVKKISGVGPAGFDILGFDDTKSILSLYYSITFETGFLGLFILGLFFVYIIVATMQIRTSIGFFLLVSVISGAIHYYFISNFWYPWFWFISAFAIFCNKRFVNE